MHSEVFEANESELTKLSGFYVISTKLSKLQCRDSGM